VTEQPDELPTPPDAADLAPSEPPRRRRFVRAVARGLFEWAKSVSLAILLFLVVRSFFVEAFKIPTGSMEGTLLVGDFLLVNKLVYGAEVPYTGRRLPAIAMPKYRDIVVFQYPVDPEVNFVKRLVGLPGDTIAMENGELIRNGRREVEPYVTHSDPGGDPAGEDFGWQRGFLVRRAGAFPSYHPSRNNWGPIVVPPRQYFMLGDNRDNSLDSRYWGFVPTRWCVGDRWWSTTATHPIRPTPSTG